MLPPLNHIPATTTMVNCEEEEEIVYTGVLYKKGSGGGPFGRRNWKSRYFVLTETKLRYFTREKKQFKGEVRLLGCDEHSLEVMPADSIKTGFRWGPSIWRIAINTPERRLLIAASSEAEMHAWVNKLTVALRLSQGLHHLKQRRSTMPVGGIAAFDAYDSEESGELSPFSACSSTRSMFSSSTGFFRKLSSTNHMVDSRVH